MLEIPYESDARGLRTFRYLAGMTDPHSYLDLA